MVRFFLKNFLHKIGTDREMLANYMIEFCWKKTFGGPDCFYSFWLQVAQHWRVQAAPDPEDPLEITEHENA